MNVRENPLTIASFFWVENSDDKHEPIVSHLAQTVISKESSENALPAHLLSKTIERVPSCHWYMKFFTSFFSFLPTISAEKEFVSSEKESASTEKETVSSEKESASTEKETVSSEKEPASTEKETVSSEKEPASTEKEPVKSKNSNESQKSMTPSIGEKSGKPISQPRKLAVPPGLNLAQVGLSVKQAAKTNVSKSENIELEKPKATGNDSYTTMLKSKEIIGTQRRRRPTRHQRGKISPETFVTPTEKAEESFINTNLINE